MIAGAQRHSGTARQKAGGPGAILVLVLFCAAAPLRLCAAQAPAYDPAHLACAQFSVKVETSVTTVLQGTRRVEEVRRDGLLSVKGAPATGGIELEAWWDSLTLTRRAEGHTLTPDAVGLLGGRYRGVLSTAGVFTRTTAPWIPDEVAEVSDLSVALDDLFPVFGRGRMTSLGTRNGLRRYRLVTDSAFTSPSFDDRNFGVKESERSDGVVGWGPRGLESWVRTVTAETEVEETPQRKFRSTVVQRIEVRRVGVCAGG